MTTDTDPRLESEYVTTVGGGEGTGTVTLVGVVHDHPASVYRVQRVVESASPDVLGLELPPLAVPLYERHAADERSPPALGGEMSAAVQAATTDDVVGLDGPSRRFCRELLSRLCRDRASVGTVYRTLRSLASVSKTALACRLAASVTAHTSLRIAVGDATDHETGLADPPARQAADESRQIGTATAVLDAFEATPSSRFRSESREAHMADRLRELRQRGDVVAVVGVGHFDPIRDRLADP